LGFFELQLIAVYPSFQMVDITSSLSIVRGLVYCCGKSWISFLQNIFSFRN